MASNQFQFQFQTNLFGFLFAIAVISTSLPATMSSMCKCHTRPNFGISFVDCINSTVPGGLLQCQNYTVHDSPDNLLTLFPLSCYAGYRAVFAFNKSSKYCKVNNCNKTPINKVGVETASNRTLGLVVIGTCQAIGDYCPAYPRTRSNHMVFEGRGSRLNDTANVWCLRGFAQSGPNLKLRCLPNGRWSHPTFTCQAITRYCPPVPSIPSGTIRYPQYQIGARAYLSCNLGYTPSDTSNAVMICNSHDHLQGKWMPSPSCQSISDYCPSLPSISNGKIQATTNQVNATATVSCNPGYILRGSSTVRCQTNNKNEGIWSTIPSCLAISNFCPAVPNITNGQIQATASNIDATATVMCDKGFTLNGSSSIRCISDSQSQGRWSPIPSCPLKPGYCSELPNISNGQVHATATHLHANVTVVCNQGYRLSGSPTVRCIARNRKRGRWSILPHCLLASTTATARQTTTSVHLPSTTTHPPQTTATTTMLAQSTTQPTAVTTPPTTQPRSPTTPVPVTSLPTSMPATDLDQNDTLATSAPASTQSLPVTDLDQNETLATSAPASTDDTSELASTDATSAPASTDGEATSAPAALSSAPWISTAEQSPSPDSSQTTSSLISTEATPSGASQNAANETSTDTIVMTRPVIIGATTKVQDVETAEQAESSSPDSGPEHAPVYKPTFTDAATGTMSTKWIAIGGGVGAGLLLLLIGLVSVTRKRHTWKRFGQGQYELGIEGTKSNVRLVSMVSNTVNGGSPLGDLTRTPSTPNLYSQSPLGGGDAMSILGAQLFRSRESTPMTSRKAQPLPAQGMQATVPLFHNNAANVMSVMNNNNDSSSVYNIPTTALQFTTAGSLGEAASLVPAPSSTAHLQGNSGDADPQHTVAMTQDPASD